MLQRFKYLETISQQHSILSSLSRDSLNSSTFSGDSTMDMMLHSTSTELEDSSDEADSPDISEICVLMDRAISIDTFDYQDVFDHELVCSLLYFSI